MRVNVLKEDIDGRQCGPRSCPVARAIQREFPRAEVRVGHSNISAMGWSTVNPIPDWVRRYDVWVACGYGDEPQPFEFELETPWQKWNENRLEQVLEFAKTMDPDWFTLDWDGCIFGEYARANKLGLSKRYSIQYGDKRGFEAVAEFLNVPIDDAYWLVGVGPDCESLEEHIARLELYLQKGTIPENRMRTMGSAEDV